MLRWQKFDLFYIHLYLYLICFYDFSFFLYDLLLRHLMRTFSCYPCLKAAAVLILIPIIYFHYQRLEYVVKCHCQTVLWGDDITANDVIQRNQHWKTKKINLTSIVITDVKLTSQLKKDSQLCSSFSWQRHYHCKVPGAWLCMYVGITVLF